MFPSRLLQDLSKTESTSSLPNIADNTNNSKPPEQLLSSQEISAIHQKGSSVLHSLYTQKILTDLTSNSSPSEQYSAAIAVRRLKALIEVVEQNEQLHLIIDRLEDENLEFKKLIKDTTDMINIVKKTISKHINSNEILAEEPMDTSYTPDSDGYDSDEHKHKKMKISN